MRIGFGLFGRVRSGVLFRFRLMVEGFARWGGVYRFRFFFFGRRSKFVYGGGLIVSVCSGRGFFSVKIREVLGILGLVGRGFIAIGV